MVFGDLVICHVRNDQQVCRWRIADIRGPVTELRDLVYSNSVPLETALQSVTSNPARVFGLPSKGHIRVGFDADLAILTQDFEVRSVVARGRVLVAESAPVVRGFFE